MRAHPPATGRRWQAAVIIVLFFLAVAGAAAVGWWYARESPPHQGPIVLISVDRLSLRQASDEVGAVAEGSAAAAPTPAIEALAGDSVVFERAYTHSPQLLPAHASILSGRLPLEHGVRDDVGFSLDENVRTLAEQLESRGFETGAAVSSFLLRPQSGLAQGFEFFDAEMPDTATTPAVERGAGATLDAAEKWVQHRQGQRFFLFVQLEPSEADAAVARLVGLLKRRGLYDEATIVFVGVRGASASISSLDEAAIRVPLMVKQPDRLGAGRRVRLPVQHIDLVPTILDLVRAPLPGSLRGRSLRGVLDDEDATIEAQPIYSEALGPYFRLGGDSLVAATGDRVRYVRSAGEQVIAIDPTFEVSDPRLRPEVSDLRTWLERLLANREIGWPDRVAAEDEQRFALLGFLPGLRPSPGVPSPLTREEQRAVADAQIAAAVAAGQLDYPRAVRELRALAREYPQLAPLHYQLGMLLVRSGRLEEASEALRTAAALRPDAPEPAIALAGVFMREGDHAAAREQAELAAALAEKTHDARARAAAHEAAARAALARKDAEAAERHARAAEEADPRVPLSAFVRGQLLFSRGDYGGAAAAFAEAVDALREHRIALADLHLAYAESLAHLERYSDAEAQLREEIRAFPHNIQAYTSLAMLYRASNRHEAAEEVLTELVAAAPTAEGYAAAARLWTILGDRSRAAALRTEARARFRGDPSLALLGRDARR